MEVNFTTTIEKGQITILFCPLLLFDYQKDEVSIYKSFTLGFLFWYVTIETEKAINPEPFVCPDEECNIKCTKFCRKHCKE